VNVVYAKDWISAHVDGALRRFHPGSHWPADDPYVRAHPGQFSDDPRYHLSFTESRPTYFGDVEQASAAPGERRSTRRT
jgi:hypothetical protein